MDSQETDVEDVFDATPTDEPLPPMKRGVGRPKKARPRLPDDDPFLLIDSLDQAGGRKGHKRMPAVPIAAFRLYCALAPTLRSAATLHKHLEREWERAPTRETLTRWMREYDWVELAKEYDLNLARWRFAQSERDRRDADQRQARAGRAMQQLAGNQIMRIVREANEWRPYVVGPDGQVLRDARGNPVKAPKPSMAGIQGLALMYKIAVETERVALGAPTQVTSATVQGVISGETTTNHIVMTLDEWRKQTAADRASVRAETPAGQIVDALPPGLPAPTQQTQTVKQLGLDDAHDLPDEWFHDDDAGDDPQDDDDDGSVVDADE